MSNNKPTQCCGCFDLATGSKIIGGVITITSIIGVIYCIESLVNHNDYFEPSTATDNTREFFNIVYGMSLAVELLIATTGILLIIGASKEKSTFMIPYLIVSMIVIVVTLFFNSIGIFSTFSHDGLLAFIYLVKIIYDCVQLYWWICVRTHYKEINQRKRRPVEFYNILSATPA